jgi:arginine/ornithine N-succinyltransferase beta subunit
MGGSAETSPVLARRIARIAHFLTTDLTDRTDNACLFLTTDHTDHTDLACLFLTTDLTDHTDNACLFLTTDLTDHTDNACLFLTTDHTDHTDLACPFSPWISQVDGDSVAIRQRRVRVIPREEASFLAFSCEASFLLSPV